MERPDEVPTGVVIRDIREIFETFMRPKSPNPRKTVVAVFAPTHSLFVEWAKLKNLRKIDNRWGNDTHIFIPARGIGHLLRGMDVDKYCAVAGYRMEDAAELEEIKSIIAVSKARRRRG